MHALVAITISDNADDFLGDGFFGASEFSLFGGGDICVFDGRLVHEVLIYGYGGVLEIISLGKNPLVPRGRFLDTDVHGEGVLDLFHVFKEARGCASEQ